MKHMILSFKTKADVISDHFMFPKRFAGYSRFYDLRRGVQSPKSKSDILSPKTGGGHCEAASLSVATSQSEP